MKHVLITGGALRLGAALCRAFAQAGWQVWCHYQRSADAAQALQAELQAEGADVRLVQADLGQSADVQRMMDHIGQATGPLDGLVNNAGSVTREPFLDASEAEMDRVLGLNVKGAAIVAQEVARGMRSRGARGSIVNISSVVGLVGARNRSLYAASKHAVMGLTRSMALELGPLGIRVNAVCPGLVNTPLAADLMADKDFVAATSARIPLGRIMEPEDIAGPAVFLLSDAAAGVTGIALPVDGGVTAE